MAATAISLRPFVPSGPDFAGTKAFLGEIGFAVEWEQGGMAGLRFGPAAIILQHIDVPLWQQNQMLVVEVDTLDGYWAEIASKDLETRYPGARLRPPTDFPWGREVHVIDPAGVCWHFREPHAKA